MAKKKDSGGAQRSDGINQQGAATDQVILTQDQLIDSLASHLLSAKLCDTSEEATPTAEAIVEECCQGGEYDNKEVPHILGPMTKLLQEYFDQLTSEKASEIVRSVLGIRSDDEEEGGYDSSTNDAADNDTDNSDIDNAIEDDDGEYIGEGECELCERTIKLTRHHLIPKSTWSKMKKRISNACEALSANQEEKARMILGGNLIEELPQDVIDNPGNSMIVRRFLSATCNICRPCHSTVHRLHDEMELAESYNTVDKLLEDEELLKFAKWASKQKCGKFSVSYR